MLSFGHILISNHVTVPFMHLPSGMILVYQRCFCMNYYENNKQPHNNVNLSTHVCLTTALHVNMMYCQCSKSTIYHYYLSYSYH